MYFVSCISCLFSCIVLIHMYFRPGNVYMYFCPNVPREWWNWQETSARPISMWSWSTSTCPRPPALTFPSPCSLRDSPQSQVKIAFRLLIYELYLLNEIHISFITMTCYCRDLQASLLPKCLRLPESDCVWWDSQKRDFSTARQLYDQVQQHHGTKHAIGQSHEYLSQKHNFSGSLAT